MAVRNRFREGYVINDDYYTPLEVFNALNVEFDLDVCSPIGGTGLVPAKKFYSINDDGLISPWFGKVWMNPPYSGANPWHEKFITHGNGIGLVQVSKNKSFIQMWQHLDGILMLPHNFKFIRPDGSKKEIFMAVAVVS